MRQIRKCFFVLWASFFLFILSPALSLAGTVYMWTDAKGGKHVSEAPPPEAANSVEELHHADRKPPTQAELREETRRDQERMLETDQYERQKEMQSEKNAALQRMTDEQMRHEKVLNEQAKAEREVQRRARIAESVSKLQRGPVGVVVTPNGPMPIMPSRPIITKEDRENIKEWKREQRDRPTQ